MQDLEMEDDAIVWRKRQIEDDDEEEESEDEIDSDDEEISTRAAYEEFLPEAKLQVGDAKASLKDMEMKICLVCRGRYKGWVALMAHARTYKKKKVSKHRGYFKALEEVIQPKAEDRGRKVELSQARVNSSVLLEDHKQLVWPPVIMVTCESAEEARNKVGERVVESVMEVEDGFLVVCKKVPLSLALLRCLKEQCREIRPQQMEKIDPQRKIVDWSSIAFDEAASLIKGLTKDDEKLAESLQARKLELWKMEVANEKANSEKTSWMNLLKAKQTQLTELRQRQPVLPCLDDLELVMKRKLALVEEEIKHKENGLNREILLRRTKIQRQKNEELEKHKRLERTLRNETKRMSERMKELEERRAKEEKEQEKKMAAIETHYRAEELKLIAFQENELKQLEEEGKGEIQQAYSDFLEKQNSAKRGQLLCIICCREFSDDLKRAVLIPCGHYTVCIECCMAIWNVGKRNAPAKCPICRDEIKRKPEEAIS